jgi:hypothetical protein
MVYYIKQMAWNRGRKSFEIQSFFALKEGAIMTKIATAVVVAVLSVLLGGCAEPRRPTVVQYASIKAHEVAPGQCVNQINSDTFGGGLGTRRESVVRVINDTLIPFQVSGPSGESIVICPAGGFADFRVGHYQTDLMYRDVSISFRSVGQARPMVGYWRGSFGGVQTRREEVRTSYASPVY